MTIEGMVFALVFPKFTNFLNFERFSSKDFDFASKDSDCSSNVFDSSSKDSDCASKEYDCSSKNSFRVVYFRYRS